MTATSKFFADFMHDRFKSRRSWNLHDGWVFKFRFFNIKIEGASHER